MKAEWKISKSARQGWNRPYIIHNTPLAQKAGGDLLLTKGAGSGLIPPRHRCFTPQPSTITIGLTGNRASSTLARPPKGRNANAECPGSNLEPQIAPQGHLNNSKTPSFAAALTMPSTAAATGWT